MMERWEADAKRARAELISLGGRPSRDIRHDVIWETTYKDGMLSWFDEDRGTPVRAEERNYLYGHWADEARHFNGELERWQEFKNAQARPSSSYLLQSFELIQSQIEREFLHEPCLYMQQDIS